MKITIVDYGMGNIYSLQSALKFLGYDSICSNKIEDIINADRIILPGVGSFKIAMDNIINLKIDSTIKIAVRDHNIPILGICLGMQLLGVSSTEDSYSKGLDLFQGEVTKFTDKSVKIPHVGFNSVLYPENSILYKGIRMNSDFYFVHSFKMNTDELEGIGYTSNGERFVASFEQGNVFGTQFHPEKSQMNGLMLLRNFITF